MELVRDDYEVFGDHEYVVTIDGKTFVMRRKSNSKEGMEALVRNYDAVVQTLHMSLCVLRSNECSDAFKQDIADRLEELVKTL